MKLSLTLIAFWLAMALGQTTTVCTADLASTDDCADVINPIACYNQFGFSGTRTLACIDGKNDAERSRKARRACHCCSCVGTRMCTWVTQNNICNGVS
ncbi:hypothetical protein QBC33DRAFT_462738 [Phialemonium atrogriseum]|uniref:SCR protein n=1 Tax=Phialemonium atrogriseum TaxID=1093897 RepID=A0AAJ0BQW5_9PEZI|nr:uncharacterized protein QBC33DRAFT_462738 [Phialemonium atrogriseum]KAK1761748.1 hypothetical protein QBC33DRAFT_462738 [Phialemonium atrogriseum]